MRSQGTTLAELAVCGPNYGAFVWTAMNTVGMTWQMLSVTLTANSMGVARVHLPKNDIAVARPWDDVELLNGASAVKLVRGAEAEVEESLQDARWLDPFGVEIRYPGDGPETLPGDEDRALELARAARAAIEDIIDMDA